MKRILLTAAILAAFAQAQAAPQRELRLLNPSPLSGQTADTGLAQAQSIEKSMEYLSKGTDLKVIYKSVDDEFKKEVAIKVIPQQIQIFKPAAVVGVFGTPNVQLLVKEKVFESSKVPMIGSRSGGAEGVFSEYTHHIRASFEDEILGFLKYSNQSKICVFHVDSSFGKEGVNAAKKFIAENPNLKIDFASASHAPNSIAVEDGIKSLMNQNCSLIVMQTTTAPAKAALKEIKKLYDSKYKKDEKTLGDKRPTVSVLAISSIDSAGLDYKNVLNNNDNIWLAATSIVANNAEEFADRPSFLSDYKNFLEESKLVDSTTTREGFLISKVTIEGAKRVKGEITGEKMNAALKDLKVRISAGMVLDLSKKRASNRVFYQYYNKTTKQMVDM